MTKSKALVKVGKIQQRILLIRGEKVIIDADLAEAYGVTTKALNQAIRRNADLFTLSNALADHACCRIGFSSAGWCYVARPLTRFVASSLTWKPPLSVPFRAHPYRKPERNVPKGNQESG